MKICAFNGGKLASIEGAVIRYRNLIIKNCPDCSTTWIDPVSYKAHYKTEDLDTRLPPRVKLVPGKVASKNPLVELFQRERHYRKTVREADFDVGLFYNAWGTYLARQWIRRQRKPLVFEYIDLMHEFRSNPAERWIARQATAEGLRNCDLVVTTAHKILEDARQFNSNAILVPNGVDVAEFGRARPLKIKHPSVGFAGGWGPWVDFEPLLRAAERKPRVNFYLIGDGMQRPFAEKWVREHGLKNVYLSDGFVPHHEVSKWMASFDVCTIPFKINKLTDAVCPIKLLEYWSLKKPVIVSPTYEMRRIGGKGVSFANSHEEWNEAIDGLLADARMRNRLGGWGFRNARAHYDWRVLSKRYIKAIKGLV